MSANNNGNGSGEPPKKGNGSADGHTNGGGGDAGLDALRRQLIFKDDDEPRDGPRDDPRDRAVVWRDPEPLIQPEGAEAPYPIEVLPEIMRRAVIEYRCEGQQPLSLVAGSALAASSLAAQGLADVDRHHDRLVGPISLYLASIAESGERKTAVDRAFVDPVRGWMDDARSLREDDRRAAQAKQVIWETERQAVLGQLKAVRSKPAKTNGAAAAADAEELKRQLIELGDMPPLPIQPELFYEDVTPEQLVIGLAAGWPSASLWSDEAGLVVGGRGMQDDSGLAYIALLNRLWDGRRFARSRVSGGRVILRGRRFTSSLQMQPVIFSRLLARQDGAVRGMGLLSRFLLSWPDSTAGERYFNGTVEAMPGLARFGDRLCELLDMPLPATGDDMVLMPPRLSLAPGAKRSWIEFHDRVERELGRWGRYAAIKDIAAKIAEQAARIAGVFHVLEWGPGGEIDGVTMDDAIVLARWYLDEARRVMGVTEVARVVSDAALLIDWLGQRKLSTFRAREILQLGPVPLRDKERRDAALDLLAETLHIRAEGTARGTRFVINPGALGPHQ